MVWRRSSPWRRSRAASGGSASRPRSRCAAHPTPPRAVGELAATLAATVLLADGLRKAEEPIWVVPSFDLLQPPIIRSVVRLLPVGEARIDVVLVRLP